MNKKNSSFLFAFHSFFRNSGFAEVTVHSEMKKKILVFFLHFTRFFVTLALPKLLCTRK